MRGMRKSLLLIALIALVGCQPKAPEKPQVRQKLPDARVLQTLTLPGDDGRVHIIAMPTSGALNYAHRCLLHVGANGSTMACTDLVDSVRLNPPDEGP